MADPYAELLKRFDASAIARYNITARDLEMVERYVQILQPNMSESVWEEAVRIGGEYGASIIIHEVMQIRLLRRAGVNPMQYEREDLQQVLAQHINEHVIALYEEHLYLQQVLMRKFDQYFEVATLVKPNYPNNDTDFNLLLESEIGVFLFEEHRVEQARHTIERLKGV